MLWESAAERRLLAHNRLCATPRCGLHTTALCVCVCVCVCGCRRWIWDTTLEFLRAEGYRQDNISPQEVTDLLKDAMNAHQWPHNPRAQMCRMYIIGKGKSLKLGTWMWHPIAAYPQPQIDKHYLRTAARAFSIFWKTLVHEMPAAFQVIRVNDAAPWYRALDEIGINATCELDCKD